jgi:hypothetical protein
MTSLTAFMIRCALAGAGALGLVAAAQAADPLRGAALYQTYCLDCHGSAEAPTNPTSLNARNLAPVLREGIANPRSGMGFLGDILTTSDIDSIVAYLGTTPARVDFTDQALGGSSPTRSVTIRAGREDLTALRASAQGDFSIADNSCGDRVPAGGSCSVAVRFEPRASGERGGLLSISHSGVTSPVRVELAGRGRADLPQPAALLTLEAASIAFGTVSVGQSSAETALIVRNSGNADLTVLSAVAPIGFPVRNDCSGAIRPGSSCRIAVAFQPASLGSVAGDLVLVSNQPGGAVRVPLTGTGAREVSRLAWTGNRLAIEFGATAIGRSAAAQTLSLVNQGPGPATLESLSISGGEAGDFVVEPTSSCQPGLTLEAGGQCLTTIGFAPRGTGERTARLAIQASAQLPGALALTGIGTPAAPAIAATNVGAGGCTLGGGHQAFDPFWPLLTGLAVWVLVWRRRQPTQRLGKGGAQANGAFRPPRPSLPSGSDGPGPKQLRLPARPVRPAHPAIATDDAATFAPRGSQAPPDPA